MEKEFRKDSPPLILPERAMQFPPTLALALGSSDLALFLQELHASLLSGGVCVDKHFWTQESLDGWHRRFPWWSYSKVRRTIRRLKGFQAYGRNYAIIRSRVLSGNTASYTIEYGALLSLLQDAKKARTEEREEVMA